MTTTIAKSIALVAFVVVIYAIGKVVVDAMSANETPQAALLLVAYCFGGLGCAPITAFVICRSRRRMRNKI